MTTLNMSAEAPPSATLTAAAREATDLDGLDPVLRHVLIVAGPRDGVAADYAAWVRRNEGRAATILEAAELREWGRQASGDRRLSSIVIFLSEDRSVDRQSLLDGVFHIAEERQAARICLVSTFRTHFGDERAAAIEREALRRLSELPARIVVIRPSHILSYKSKVSARLRAVRFCHPLIPASCRTCCLTSDELFAAIDVELDRRSVRKKIATYTLLGPNRPWRTWLKESSRPSGAQRVLAALATVLSFLLVGHVAGLAFHLAARRWPKLRRLSFDTLRPQSMGELLALYNAHNHRHVKIVGYNNGVVHFGWRYPERTVISTVLAARPLRARQGAPAGATQLAKVDSGLTIKSARGTLERSGRELCVLPNFSYVSLGTAFFIPIHGSASDYSTVADTIEKAILYDPETDRIVAAKRGDEAFGRYLYNLKRDALLLRLYLRIKEKSSYYVRRQELDSPSGEQVLSLFDDREASNIELRKAQGASRTVQVCKYYTRRPMNDLAAGAAAENDELLEVPRDSIGRLWDKLEEHPLAGPLHHAFVRRLAHHMELFFTREEFLVFWATHGGQPIRKLQLRYIKRDGMPHSPFRDRDCVSADLFMLKKHKFAFQDYLRKHFRDVKSNPGKHSA